ncbi:UbiA prenyltransferase family-domain-containing protein [Trametes meyenii]|nr:UbiA prenyltransferase family-domain-containing protein [Trametes meyenii]
MPMDLVLQSGSGLDVLKTIIKVSRPAGWCFGPTLYAIGVVHAVGNFKGRVIPRARNAPLVFLQLLSLSFPLALVVFGVNDVYDYDTDVHNPRKGADSLEGAVLSPSCHTTVLLGASLATALILSISAATRSLANLLVSCSLVFLSWTYSAPPLRLKERPVLDSLSNGTIVVLAYLSGYTARGGSLRRVPTGGLVLGLCTAGVHALGAAVDAEVDATAGQRTIATALGPRGAIAFGALSYLAALCAERRFSVFGVYLLGGLLVILVPLFGVERAHLAFRAVVYGTVGMSAVWFAEKAMSWRGRRNYETDVRTR